MEKGLLQKRYRSRYLEIIEITQKLSRALLCKYKLWQDVLLALPPPQEDQEAAKITAPAVRVIAIK